MQLSFLLILGLAALACARPVFEPFNGIAELNGKTSLKRSASNEYELRVNHVHPLTGGKTNVNYAAKLSGKVNNIDDILVIEAVSCTNEGIYMKANGEELPVWQEGEFVVGGPQWACEIANKPFYYIVTGAVELKGEGFFVPSHPVQVQDVLSDAKISFDFQPDPEAHQAIQAKRDLDSQDNDIERFCEYDHSWDILDFNYNTWSGKGDAFFIGKYTELDCKNCYARLQAKFHFELDISHYSVAAIVFKIEGDAHINVDGSFGLSTELLHLLNKQVKHTVAGVKLPTLTFNVGPVPVVITPETELDVIFEFDSNVEAKVTYGFDASGDMMIGLNYTKDGGFQPMHSQAFAFNTHKLGIDLEASAKVRLYTSPSIDLKLWGIVGVHLSALPYAEADIGYNYEKCATALSDFEIMAGVDYGVGIDAITVPDNVPILGGHQLVPAWNHQGHVRTEYHPKCSFCQGCVTPTNN